MPTLIDFIKNNMFVQNFYSFIFSRIPGVVEHNLGKHYQLRKAFFLTEIEKLEGDYFEFGIFTGSSFVFAMRFYRKLVSKKDRSCKFFGFDSFCGFGKITDADKHPFYTDDTFSVSEHKICNNIARHSGGLTFKVIKGFFEESLKQTSLDKLGSKKARIIFIDCDLKAPSEIVLNFMKPAIQKGTILIMDDFFSYKGDPALGVAGAFFEFEKQNPLIKWRFVGDYGFGGVSYICFQV